MGPLSGVQNVDWNDLRREDFDREEVQRVVREAVVTSLYERDKGNWISLGRTTPKISLFMKRPLEYP